jgi:hypothetical protein
MAERLNDTDEVPDELPDSLATFYPQEWGLPEIARTSEDRMNAYYAGHRLREARFDWAVVNLGLSPSEARMWAGWKAAAGLYMTTGRVGPPTPAVTDAKGRPIEHPRLNGDQERQARRFWATHRDERDEYGRYLPRRRRWPSAGTTRTGSRATAP